MGPRFTRLTVSQRLRLLAGKGRRFYLSLVGRGYVRRSLARRRGECRRCGACCALGYRCQALRHNGQYTECVIHRFRPPNCRLFPIDERDLADRDVVLPGVPCGFRFGPPDRDAPPTPDPPGP